MYYFKQHPFGQLAYTDFKLNTWFNAFEEKAWIFDEQDLQDQIKYEPECEPEVPIFQALLSIISLNMFSAMISKKLIKIIVSENVCILVNVSIWE